ncbi:hypothetical protein D3C73_1331440 [compost metagenome]
MIINIAEAFFGLYWCKKIQNRQWLKVLIPMNIIYIIAFMLLFILNNSTLIIMLPIIYILIGCANSVYDIYDNIAIYEGSKKGYETSYVTFERFIEGIVTALLPIISSNLLKGNNNSIIKSTFLIASISFFVILIYLLKRYNKRQYN